MPYKYEISCNTCDKVETYEGVDEDFLPDGWFVLHGNGNPVRKMRGDREVRVLVQPHNLCWDCYERIFGPHGIAHRYEDDDDFSIGLTD